MSISPRIVHVDKNGIDAEGIDYRERPTRKARRAGYVTLGPVVLQYPDGRREDGFEVLVTPKGLDLLSRQIGSDKGRLN